MRSTYATLAFAAAFLSANAANAERRMFMIANNPNGYGVDRCLASGATCGAAIAAASCRYANSAMRFPTVKWARTTLPARSLRQPPAAARAAAATTTSPSSACADRITFSVQTVDLLGGAMAAIRRA